MGVYKALLARSQIPEAVTLHTFGNSELRLSMRGRSAGTVVTVQPQLPPDSKTHTLRARMRRYSAAVVSQRRQRAVTVATLASLRRESVQRNSKHQKVGTRYQDKKGDSDV